MARRRLQQKGDLYEQNGWWKLRWREDVKLPSGEIARQWSKPAWIGPTTGAKKLTQKQAKRIAWENFLSAIDQNNVVPKSIITLREFVQEHFVPSHVDLKKPASRLFYSSLLEKHIVPAFGSLRLRDVTGAHVQKFVTGKIAERYVFARKKRKGEENAPPPELRQYSPRMIQALVNTVSAIFTKAEKLGMFIGRNPAALATIPEVTPVREKHALTLPEFQNLLAMLPEPTYGLAFTAALTSMNIAEVCGLRWKYVNLSDGWTTVDGEALAPHTLAVRFQWAHGEYGTLKRESRRRNIPLARSLVKYLADLQGRSTFATSEDPVFVGKTGKPVDQHNEFNRRLKPIAVKQGLPWVGWHTFRRTHTTLADQHAMSQSDRMAMMGHSAAMQTMRYTDEDLNRRREVLDRIATALESKSQDDSVRTVSTSRG